MSKLYQELSMVAQLGNDPSALEQQQQYNSALAHMNVQQQQLAQQQVALEQQKQQCPADTQQQLALAQQQQQLTDTQQQLALAQQQSQQGLNGVNQQLATLMQQRAEQERAAHERATNVGATNVGASNVSPHSSAMARSRDPSVLGAETLSFNVAAEDDLLSDNSLTMSPEVAAGSRSRAG